MGRLNRAPQHPGFLIMLFFLGLIIVFGSVLYGYVMSHGNLLALWQPFEMLIICGAAFGAFLLGNPGNVIMRCFKLTPQIIISNPKIKKKNNKKKIQLQKIIKHNQKKTITTKKTTKK